MKGVLCWQDVFLICNKQGRNLDGYFAIDVKSRREQWRIIFQLLCLLGACCYIPATAQVVLVDNGKSYAELTEAEKDAVSHRGKALRSLEEELKKQFLK